MAVITITLPEEIKVKLQEVENKSGLIANLLNQHFEGEESLQILKIKREELEDKLKNTLKQFDYKIEVKEKEIQSEEEAIKEKAERDERIRLAVIKRTAEMDKIPFTGIKHENTNTFQNPLG